MSRQNILEIASSATPATPEDRAVRDIVDTIEKKRPLPEIIYGQPNLPPRGYRVPERQSYEVQAMLKMLERGEPGMTLTYREKKDAEIGAERMRRYASKYKKQVPVVIEKCGLKVGVTVTGRNPR